MTEAELIEYMDSVESPLVTCSRLFLPHPSATLTALSHDSVRSLQDVGFVVLDDVLSMPVVTAARDAARSMHSSGGFCSSGANAAAEFTDTHARRDSIAWLHPDQPSTAALTPPALHPVTTFLQQVRSILLHLTGTEYQIYTQGNSTSVSLISSRNFSMHARLCELKCTPGSLLAAIGS